MSWSRCLFPLLSLAVACGGAAPPAEVPQEPVETPAPIPPVETATAPEPEPEPEPEPVAEPQPERVKSSATIGGVSLTEVTGEQIVAELQKLGWAPENVAISGGTVGRYENVRMGIATAKAEGLFELIRPAAQPRSGGASMMAPKDQKAMRESTAAVYLDESADVIVIIAVDGKLPDAKKLLDKLVKR